MDLVALMLNFVGGLNVTVCVPHTEMTDSRHKFGKSFTLDVNSYQRITGAPRRVTIYAPHTPE